MRCQQIDAGLVLLAQFACGHALAFQIRGVDASRLVFACMLLGFASVCANASLLWFGVSGGLVASCMMRLQSCCLMLSIVACALSMGAFHAMGAIGAVDAAYAIDAMDATDGMTCMTGITSPDPNLIVNKVELTSIPKVS